MAANPFAASASGQIEMNGRRRVVAGGASAPDQQGNFYNEDDYEEDDDGGYWDPGAANGDATYADVNVNDEGDAFRRRRRATRRGYSEDEFDDGSSMKKFWIFAFLSLLLALVLVVGHSSNTETTTEPAGANNNVPMEGANNKVPMEGSEDKNDTSEPSQVAPTKQHGASVHYHPEAAAHENDPFQLSKETHDWYGSIFAAPPHPAFLEEHHDLDDNLGYFQSPSVHNGTLCFLSEGDLYLTYLSKDAPEKVLVSMKLTTTIGNVLTPILNPVKPYLVAFTATYTGVREAYLMDLRPGYRNHPSFRLTYMGGVSAIVSWDSTGTILTVAAANMDIGLPDTRLYQISILQQEKKERGRLQRRLESGNDVVSKITPIPLAQAIDGAVDPETQCLYFTRFKQSSNTARYVGGTAEHLWVYCPNKKKAKPLTDDYRGTSKAPRIMVTASSQRFLLFLSDRIANPKKNEQDKWVPSTMSLWAMEILSNKMGEPFPVTPSIACAFNGIPLSEYAIDAARGDVILRIGADLHVIDGSQVSQLFQDKRMRRRTKDTDENQTTKKNKKKHVKATNDDDGDDAVGDDDNGDDDDDDDDATGKAEDNYAKPKKGEPKIDTKTAKEMLGSSNIVLGDLTISKLPIAVYSDFQNQHERLIPTNMPFDLSTMDVFETPYGSISSLLTVRGQLYVAPAIDLKGAKPYQGAGMNMPPRTYRVSPGSTTGGMVRILAARHIPTPKETGSRFAVVLATDPLSPTAEHAFYLFECDAASPPSFADLADLPEPFIGGHINGGSVKDGGLGSVQPDSVNVSPCGRRLAWTDTDGRICVMTLPFSEEIERKVTILPTINEQGEPIIGDRTDLTWSPGGRYMAIEHNARNQFSVISIADLGDPEEWKVKVGRIVQATPDRFNSMSPTWGRTALDFRLTKMAAAKANQVHEKDPDHGGATILYFMTDRDIISDVSSPWGTRAPSPHFPPRVSIYALPLVSDDSYIANINEQKELFRGAYPGGGAAELLVSKLMAEQAKMEAEAKEMEAEAKAAIAAAKAGKEDAGGSDGGKQRRAGSKSTRLLAKDENNDDVNESENDTSTGNPTFAPTIAPTATSTVESTSAPTATPTAFQSLNSTDTLFPVDYEITYGPKNDKSYSFARSAYRVVSIPTNRYSGIISQVMDDPSLLLIMQEPGGEATIVIFATEAFPSDNMEPNPIPSRGLKLVTVGMSTSRSFMYVAYATAGGASRIKVIPNTSPGIASFMADIAGPPPEPPLVKNIVDTDSIALSVWPSLEYHQMYSDAWRMLRDYFYDPGMTNLDWPGVYERYAPLVKRCSKREELDDVLRQMSSELSALHVFVYGGEYPSPIHDSPKLAMVNRVANLGASLQRSVEWNGYIVKSIPERDPDFNLVDGHAMYSPLSDRALRMSGQHGLAVGDVIIGVNGESVMSVPDIHMLLRGKSGLSVRLDILRLASSPTSQRNLKKQKETKPEKQSDTTIEDDDSAVPEPVIVVPLSPEDASNLRYAAWEWRTRENARNLAEAAGFSLGYVHLRSMSGVSAEDSFVRGFFPDYDKQALIVDVRHNRGGNIDAWVLETLQRRAWMYWESRTRNITTGGLGWDEQFAFRGHLVVLMDEHTASDGEGFSRGVSELGLGKLVGTRTWGGGIWLSSDNHMVDGGIATAPEIGTYNANFGWGLGIEQMGVEPDIVVDNNPREVFDGKDAQLERAIDLLKEWMEEEPVVLPKSPGPHRDMSLHDEAKGCPASR